MQRIGVAALLALRLGCVTAADEGDSIQPIVTLRDSGYLLGDLLDERVDLTLPPSFSLDPDSLPLPGRVAPWMEVRAARIEPGSGQGEQSVVVTYQIFAEVEQAERVPVPAFKLRVRDGAQMRVVEVPAKSFLLSPALPPTLTDEDRELKPALPPQMLSGRSLAAGLVLSMVAAAACGVYLLWAYDRLPFLPRAPGPFTRLWRSWRRRAGAQVPWRPWMAEKGRRAGAQVPWRPWAGARVPRWPGMAERRRRGLSDEDAVALLHAWHAALNIAAGETLYPSTLPRLFARAPYLSPLRTRIEDLFARSWQSFYGPTSTHAPAAADLLDMLRQAAERERGVPC